MKNATNLQDNRLLDPTAIKDKETPPPPVKYARAKLTNATEVGRELAKLYREARGGRIDVTDASRLANMLSILCRILETSELEKRIEALEKRGLT